MPDLLNDLVRFAISVKDGVLYFVPGIGRPDRVLTFTLGHLAITFTTMFFAITIGVLLGILITRVRALYNPVVKIAGMLYTIPSLALFGIMVPIVGIGFKPAVIALTLYSLLAIIRNTAVGLDEVDPAVIEAARGMGMTSWQILWQIELRLALPVILGGVRLATISTISFATIASFFAAESLGTLILEGIAAAPGRNDKIVAGALGAAALAIFFSRLISHAERVLRRSTG